MSTTSLSAQARPGLFPGMSELTFLTTPAVPSHVVAAHLGAIMWVVRHRLVPVMHTTLHALSAANEKEKERNSYTFRRQLSEKASVIPICPESAANAHMAPHAKHLCCMELIRISPDNFAWQLLGELQRASGTDGIDRHVFYVLTGSVRNKSNLQPSFDAHCTYRHGLQQNRVPGHYMVLHQKQHC